MSFNWILWPAQSADLNLTQLVWDKFDLKGRAKQLTNTAPLWQILQKLKIKLLQESWAELSSVYLQSLVERMPRICETVIGAKGGHFDDLKVLRIFFVFLFNLYLMWLKKSCILYNK